MKNNLFVITLIYKAPLEKVDEFRKEHLEFVDTYYKNGLFMVSGPQVPRIGGVIIARSNDILVLKDVLSKDPFIINNLAEYQIIEFNPTRCIPELENIVEK